MLNNVSPISVAPSPSVRVKGLRIVYPVVVFAILAAIPLVAGFGGHSHVVDLAMRIMIFAIAALALDLLVGFGAMVSFGHAVFIGIGAYATGILSSHGVDEALIALPVALGSSALFALISGFVCLRTKGAYFIMITLAFGQMAFFAAGSLSPYGGDDGLSVYQRSTVAGFDVLSNDHILYYVTFALLLICYWGCRRLVASRFGMVLRGGKENAVRVSTLGFQLKRYQLTAYVLSGMMAGLSGFLLANMSGFVAPAYMSWQRSGELLIMVILGGVGTLTGPIVGAAAFLLTEEWLGGLTEHWKIIFGPILVLVALLLPGGLSGLPSLWRRSRTNG